MRPFKSRAADVGRERCSFVARRFGQDLRLARMAAGLTQAQVAVRAGVSQQSVSEAERGHADISLETRCRLSAACGQELGLKLYPVATVSLRDSGQLAIAQAIATAAHPRWTAELEHPVAPGDLRAADLLLGLIDELLHIEVERSLVDVQAQLRAGQIKRGVLAEHERRPIRLVIAVPNTPVSRERLAPVSHLIRQTLPVTSREIWRAIRGGTPVGGDGILFVRPDRIIRASATRGERLPEHVTRP